MNSTAFRSSQRLTAIMERGGPYRCKCDMCGVKTGAEYHEIVARSITQTNEEARRLSFSRFICSVLCGDCHRGSKTNAHTPDSRDHLLATNIKRYGRERVQAALDDVKQQLRVPLYFDLPSEDDNG